MSNKPGAPPDTPKPRISKHLPKPYRAPKLLLPPEQPPGAPKTKNILGTLGSPTPPPKKTEVPPPPEPTKLFGASWGRSRWPQEAFFFWFWSLLGPCKAPRGPQTHPQSLGHLWPRIRLTPWCLAKAQRRTLWAHRSLWGEPFGGPQNQIIIGLLGPCKAPGGPEKQQQTVLAQTRLWAERFWGEPGGLSVAVVVCWFCGWSGFPQNPPLPPNH